MEGKYFDEAYNADLYVKYRPHLPKEVYRYLADLCATQQPDGSRVDETGHVPGRRLAVDIGCGSGIK